MENLVDWSRIFSAVVAPASIFFAAFVYHQNSRREKIVATLNYFENELQVLKDEKKQILKITGPKLSLKKAIEISQDDNLRPKIHRILNKYERFSHGVLLGIYDYDTVNEVLGKRIISNYDRFQKYIEYWNVAKSADSWTEFAKLAGMLATYRELHPETQHDLFFDKELGLGVIRIKGTDMNGSFLVVKSVNDGEHKVISAENILSSTVGENVTLVNHEGRKVQAKILAVVETEALADVVRETLEKVGVTP